MKQNKNNLTGSEELGSIRNQVHDARHDNFYNTLNLLRNDPEKFLGHISDTKKSIIQISVNGVAVRNK